MDPVTASYYRSILYHDGQDQRPVPPTLAQLHAWTFKRYQAMGAGSIISKQAALSVALVWMSQTKEGRAFTAEHTSLGELFGCEKPSGIDWDTIEPDSDVIVTVGDKQTPAKFIRRRAGWLDLAVGDETKSFRMSQVQLAGA